MDSRRVKNNLPTTPSYLFDKKQISDNLQGLVDLKKQSGCQVLYSIKALPLRLAIKLASSHLDGLSVSSLFEARLAREIVGSEKGIHITTPGLRESEFTETSSICSHISFNSMSQYQRMMGKNSTKMSLGLRINPKLSFAKDARFDPCRLHSKLGVDINTMNNIPKGIEGLHFHTVFSNTDYQPLEETVEKIKKKWGDQLEKLTWLNLGGGYLYHQINNHQPFVDLVKSLKTDYGVDVYIEPGKSVVGNAGYLLTTVIDRFVSDGKEIAIVDTSVNHHPEVFEYQRKPELLEENPNGEYLCQLVGSSCLAGDVFGEYRFNSELKVGDRLIFSNVGAYSLIKANRFNGYNLPDVYAIDKENIVLLKQTTYDNYREQWICS